VRVMPGAQKSFAQFQTDDVGCRHYAQATIGGPETGQYASNAAAGNAVVSCSGNTGASTRNLVRRNARGNASFVNGSGQRIPRTGLAHAENATA